MRKQDADRLLAAMPREANFDARPPLTRLLPDEDPDYLAPGAGHVEYRTEVVNNLHKIALQITELTIKEFTRFEQEIGDKFARKILLWSLKKCQPLQALEQKPLISMAALSEAIMSSGLESQSSSSPPAVDSKPEQIQSGS
jgi:hypothetical protein